MIIGEILPVALGVAISPMPIMAVILLIMSKHGRSASVAFLLGWILGIALIVTAASVAISPSQTAGDRSPSTLASVIKILLGIVVLYLAYRQWRGRPKDGAEPAPPAWMAKIDHLNAGRAFLTGALLSGVNPKNLALGLAGGVTIGSAGLTPGEVAVSVGVFVAVASCTVAAPVIAYLAAQQRVRQPLDDLRLWLSIHSSAVMTVLLLLSGTLILGKGLSGL